MINDTGADIIVLTESWFHSTLADGAIIFNRYNLAARCDRISDTKGGGVAILVKKGVNFHNVQTKHVNYSSQVASLQIAEVFIVVVYRRPLITDIQDRQLADFLSGKYANKKMILTGDFNLRHFAKNKRILTKKENNDEPTGNIWFDMTSELDLVQSVTKPTQKDGGILDFVLSRESEGTILETPMVDKSLFAGLSDHYPVRFKIVANACVTKSRRTIFDYNKMDFDQFREDVKNVGILDRVKAARGHSGKWLAFMNVFLDARMNACPTRVIIDSSNPRWCTRKIKAKKAKINRVRLSLKNTKISSTARAKKIEKLKMLNFELKDLVREAKISNDSGLLDKIEKDKKALFDHVKKTKRGGQGSPPIVDGEGNAIRTDKLKAEAFQSEFMGIFNHFQYRPMTWRDDVVLADLDVSPSRIKKKLGSINRSSAPGLDTLGPMMYKEAPDEAIEALSHIYRYCLDTGEIPIEWALVKVSPLWKGSGSKSDMAKYRQVSLASTALKILEALFLDEINRICEEENYYGESQHGFRSRRSTITNLVSYWDYVTSRLDMNKRIHVINLDMSKAFDKLNIDAILNGLERAGIGGKVGRLMEFWLKNRFQTVEVNGSRSRLCKVDSGVQQGSLTGPALFNLVTSNLTSNLEAENFKVWKYADDLKVVFEVENDEQLKKIQDGINSLVGSASEVGLSFNSSKSTLMTFGRRKRPYEFEVAINGENIPKVQDTRDLGVIFQTSTTFCMTLKTNYQKAMSIVHIVRSTIKVRSYNLLKKIYECYFLPILTYGSELFTSDKNSIRTTLAKAYRAFWRLGGPGMVIQEEILDPFQVCYIKELMFFKRIQCGKTCLEFNKMFDFSDHPGTRAYERQNLKIIGTSKASRYNFFTNVCTRWYNELDDDFRNTEDIRLFKSRIIEAVRIIHPREVFDQIPRFRTLGN